MAEIIPFKSRAKLEKEKREKVWEEWLEWERLEKVMNNYKNKENGSVFFDELTDVVEHFMTQEEFDFIESEEKVARKEMMRNNDEQLNKKTLDFSPAEWDWLYEWIESKK